MNYQKENPIGLDAIIQTIQRKLYDGLTTKWGVNLDGYGRCYRASRKDKRIIEFYKGKNEYLNLLYAEDNKFFFVADNDYKQTSYDRYQTEIELYFIVNLKNIKNDILHRADEEVRLDVVNILKKIPNTNIESIVTNIDNVFNGFDFDFKDTMQPYNIFKININIYDYSLSQKYCINN